MALPVPDTMVVEVVARAGGYEEVEKAGLWETVATTLGAGRELAGRIRERYEDMIKASAEEDEDNAEPEDFEVDDILDLRVAEGGVEEYLVKWKGEYENEEDSMSWEPLAHLQGAMELVERFKSKRERQARRRRRGQR